MKRGMIVEKIFSRLRNIKIFLFSPALILVLNFFTLFMSVSAEIPPSFRSPQRDDLPPGMLAFKSYGAPQGLTNLSIWALEQDADGFLWVGTVDGLFRYDGSRFQMFGAINGLPSARIRAILQGKKSNLWIGTTKGWRSWKEAGSEF